MIYNSPGGAERNGSERKGVYHLTPLPVKDLRKHVAWLESAINNMSAGLIMFDAEERVVVCNDFYIEMYGLSREVVKPGCSLVELLQHRVSAGGSLNMSPEQYRLELLRGLGRGQTTSLTVKTAKGREVQVKNTPMAAGGWVATHEDITERRLEDEQIARLAHYDSLTRLCNRSRFQEELRKMETRVQRGECFALFCLDLDRFKEVNDTLGHPVGDLLLSAVANRMRDCVRESDLVARLGGDEFAILQIGAGPTEASALASRLIRSISIPYELNSYQVTVGVSVGIALAPSNAIEPDAILGSADMALYRAKADGRNLHRFFEPEMDARMQARRSLEADLREAIFAQEFELVYQPMIDVRTQHVSGFEALLRWRSPTRGLLLPAEFVPVAEASGLIVALGNWVLRQSLMDALEWPSGVNVAVNLSSAQFKDQRLVPSIKSHLAASGLPTDRLELEISESLLLRDAEAILPVLQKLQEIGVRIVINDFGSGYFSLSYLRKFRFDKMKIDRSFIRDICDDSVSLAVVRAVVAMCDSLRSATTAVGVETNRQLEQLKIEGCTEVQGHLLSAPRSATEVKMWLASSARNAGQELWRAHGS